MNILFVNYGDFTTNSLNHIGGFANWLIGRGHSCIVAVPKGRDTLAVVSSPRFKACTYGEVLAAPGAFPDGRTADILHAWTPRECVRKFVLEHQRKSPSTRLIVHLEDNEEYLAAAFSGRPAAELKELADDELASLLDEGLSHPVRYRNLLRIADGCTVIIDRLKEFVPTGVPVHLLWPGVDAARFAAGNEPAELRRQLQLTPGERVIVYSGSTTFANAAEVRELVRAVHLLNKRGTAVRLVRTGYHPDAFTRDYDFEWRPFTSDVGFVDKPQLPGYLALADALVQPGKAGAFDDFRLPSKLPEFLATGKPVVLPATNLGLELTDAEDALLLKTGTAEEMAEACRRIFADRDFSKRLGAAAKRFVADRFDPDKIGTGLVGCYGKVLSDDPRTDWTLLPEKGGTESVLVATALLRETGSVAPAGSDSATQFRETIDELCRLIARAESAAANGIAAGVRDKLEKEIQELGAKAKLAENHALNLQVELQDTRREISRLEGSVASFRRLFQNYQQELARFTDEAEDEYARLRRETSLRDDKIRRMQESFSWKITSPLRALRRALMDPHRKAEAPVAPAPKPAAPALESEELRFRIDEPVVWQVPAGPVMIRGWCLMPDGSPPAKVRARIGDRTVDGVTGMRRADVAAIHGDGPAAESGFEVDVVLEPGRYPVTVEVSGQAGEWITARQETLRVFPTSIPVAVQSYEQWVHLYEGVTTQSLHALAKRVSSLQTRPLVSVVMPVYNTPEKWLRRAIDSVRSQAYEKWELCIADDASTEPHVRRILDEASANDPRIKVAFREVNGHISRASNSALELATGEFTALLDHDDELAPHALAEVVSAIGARPDADVIYSDEDKIDEYGRRSAPYFKPDFMPDLFLGQNYLTHLAVYRTKLVREAGAFRPGYEGSQDWDLALRVIERTSPGKVVHIPKVLYHWRAIPGSTALTLDQKNYHQSAAERALADHFRRTGVDAALTQVAGGHWRVRYPLPANPPLVSIIIPTRDGIHHLRRCIDSIRDRTTYPNYEIVVVDNDSAEQASKDYLAEVSSSGIRVIPYHEPFNYSAINNHAVGCVAGEVVVLLNNDIEILTADWLEEMVAHALRPEIGCVGAMLYYPDDLIQHAGVVVGVGGVAGHAFKKFPRGHEGVFNRARLAQNYSAVTAACLAIRKSVYKEVGGLDEADLAVAFNDVDFCLKVRNAGYRNLWTPFAEFYHYESASRGPENTPDKQARFRREIGVMLRRWGDQLRFDPAYNPNLSLESEDFSLACPPRVPPAPDSH